MPAAKIRVDCIAHTTSALETVYTGYRQCTSTDDGVEISLRARKLIKPGFSDEEVEELVRHGMEMGHESPLEHVSFTFAISGLSRSASHQLVRHRIASYSMQSQRYVMALGDIDYVIPPAIQGNQEAMDVFLDHMAASRAAYQKLLDLGMKPEDARFVLPEGTATKIIVSMNCRTLLHFFGERCCQRAQWEIRQAAYMMLDRCKDILPEVFSEVGPKCLSLGFCKEKHTCGLRPTKKAILETYRDVQAGRVRKRSGQGLQGRDQEVQGE